MIPALHELTIDQLPETLLRATVLPLKHQCCVAAALADPQQPLCQRHEAAALDGSSLLPLMHWLEQHQERHQKLQLLRLLRHQQPGGTQVVCGTAGRVPHEVLTHSRALV